LEIGQPDTGHDYSEECVVGAVDAFTEKDDLPSLDAINLGIADVNAFIVMVLKVPTCR
jgi:hypothetical protein